MPQNIKRVKDVEEGTFVKVLDDVPNSELTIGDEGIVIDRPEGKFLLTEELDEPLPISGTIPVEIISPVRERPRGTLMDVGREPEFGPPREARFITGPAPIPPRESPVDFGVPTTEPITGPRAPLSEDEEAELEELVEMDQNGDDMEPEEMTRLQSLGERVRRFGVAAGRAAAGAFELGAAVAKPAAIGIGRRAARLQDPEVRERIRRGVIGGAEFAAGRIEVPFAAAELGLRGVAAAETATARLIRRLTGQQVRLSSVPAGSLVRFEEDHPDSEIFRGDEGVVQFGVRRRQRRVFFPSTSETVLADPRTTVTVLGSRRATDSERRITGRRLLSRPEQREAFEERFFTPRRPTGIPPAPPSFRPRLPERVPPELEFTDRPVEPEDRFKVLLGF